MPAKRLGIVVSGGPAPGINAVIGAAAIHAINSGFEVIGFYDGFKWLCSDEFDPPVHTVRLDIKSVARIHFSGGSILRISRTNLLDNESLKISPVVKPDPQKVNLTLSRLRELGINGLLTIGGDDTALSARFLTDASDHRIRVVLVPKTIDNDVPLPQNMATFGFGTARFIGTGLVKNLMQDSQTTGRWYLVNAMGRSAGHLALAIGMSAGATLTLIPEEFDEHSSVQQIVDVIEGAILKRRVTGRPDGVALVAEGLAYRLGNRAELERLLGHEVPMDAAGHPRLAEVPLLHILKQELQRRFKDRGETLPLVSHTIGYELRSADPTPNDMSYCRSLGYHSIRLFTDNGKKPGGGYLISLVNDNLVAVDLHELVDPTTNRIRTRLVDIKSDRYMVARAYQIRLEQADLEDPVMLAKLAVAAHMSPTEFKTKFARAATPISALNTVETAEDENPNTD
ncbi:MAG: 6-phosphofructokinase [Planctomycetota bacterium]